MERNVSLEEISDGRLYTSNDMVKADCNGCAGCSKCCRGMGDSIVLDPFDIFRLCSGLDTTFEMLMSGSVRLNVVDGIVLPDLAMDAEEACTFLDKNGRCSIHQFRPGFCRMFPLGRIYENGSFSYFLQVHECPYPGKTKVKVRKWIDTPDIKLYEKFVNDWHYYLKSFQGIISTCDDERKLKDISMFVLKEFYLKPYDIKKSFFEQFYERMENAASRKW